MICLAVLPPVQSQELPFLLALVTPAMRKVTDNRVPVSGVWETRSIERDPCSGKTCGTGQLLPIPPPESCRRSDKPQLDLPWPCTVAFDFPTPEDQRAALAPPPAISFSTSASDAMEVSPAVVIARAP